MPDSDFLRYKKRYENYWNRRKNIAITRPPPAPYDRFLDEEEFLLWQKEKRNTYRLFLSVLLVASVALVLFAGYIVWRISYR